MLNSLRQKKQLSKSDKALIEKTYRETFGREMRLSGSGCRNCYNDALIEIEVYLRKGRQLRGGVVIKHEDKIYTRNSENIPAEIYELYKHKFT